MVCGEILDEKLHIWRIERKNRKPGKTAALKKLLSLSSSPYLYNPFALMHVYFLSPALPGFSIYNAYYYNNDTDPINIAIKFLERKGRSERDKEKGAFRMTATV